MPVDLKSVAEVLSGTRIGLFTQLGDAGKPKLFDPEVVLTLLFVVGFKLRYNVLASRTEGIYQSEYPPIVRLSQKIAAGDPAETNLDVFVGPSVVEVLERPVPAVLNNRAVVWPEDFGETTRL